MRWCSAPRLPFACALLRLGWVLKNEWQDRPQSHHTPLNGITCRPIALEFDPGGRCFIGGVRDTPMDVLVGHTGRVTAFTSPITDGNQHVSRQLLERCERFRQLVPDINP